MHKKMTYDDSYSEIEQKYLEECSLWRESCKPRTCDIRAVAPTVLEGFPKIDIDKDGFLSKQELRVAAATSSGNTQAILQSLERHADELAQLHNDEWGAENHGISEADLRAFGQAENESRKEISKFRAVSQILAGHFSEIDSDHDQFLTPGEIVDYAVKTHDKPFVRQMRRSAHSIAKAHNDEFGPEFYLTYADVWAYESTILNDPKNKLSVQIDFELDSSVREEAAQFRDVVREHYIALDSSKDGYVDWRELKSAMTNPSATKDLRHCAELLLDHNNFFSHRVKNATGSAFAFSLTDLMEVAGAYNLTKAQSITSDLGDRAHFGRHLDCFSTKNSY